MLNFTTYLHQSSISDIDKLASLVQLTMAEQYKRFKRSENGETLKEGSREANVLAGFEGSINGFGSLHTIRVLFSLLGT